MDFQIKVERPSPEGFVNLRRDTSWGMISFEQAKASLAASKCGMSVYDTTTAETKLIGMARVIGDGVLNLYIQDVIIAKGYRGQGLGGRIMDVLITSLQENYPADCTIGLMAAKGQASFYGRFGFQTRPSQTTDAGMNAQLNQLHNQH